MTLGRVVTGTISGGIARTSTFSNDPEIFAYGMLCALVAASFWLYVATYLEMAVSTTHSISKCPAALVALSTEPYYPRMHVHVMYALP